MELPREDIEALRYAKSLLENPSLAAKLTNYIGSPIEKAFGLLPAPWSEKVNNAVEMALRKALDIAVATVDEHVKTPADNMWHKIMAVGVGAGGGAFGLAALPLELPVSTTIMLRSIVDVARSEGEKIKTLESRLACIEVFALGGRARTDDGSSTGYFAVRAALAKSISEAVQFIAERGVVQSGASPVVRLISQIAARFGTTVSEKVAAQAVPILGAVGGAAVNLLFIDHYQDMARGHFTIRRLERKHGPEVVRAAYEGLAL
jgi:hypothetical protein